MRNPFLLTLLAAAISLSGCSTGKQPAELTIEPQSQYDQRIQDGLGSQRYTEAQIIYQRQLSQFTDQIETLDRQRKALEQGLNNAAYENDLASPPATSAEATRISNYQNAARQSQAKVARSDAELSVKRALLENERDAAILDAERKAAKTLADIESEYSKLSSMADDSSRDLINSRRQQETELQRASSLVRSKEAALLESQRFELAVSNAADVSRARASFATAQNDLDSSKAKYDAQISELERKLFALRSESASVLAQKGTAVTTAETELNRLIGVGEMLKAKPETSIAASVSDSPEYQRFVDEQDKRLADQKADIARRKQVRIGEVQSALAAEKNLISSRTRTQIAGLESVATIEKATVVAPVVTGRRVYTGDPAKDAQPAKSSPVKPSKPLASSVNEKPVTVAAFKPVLNKAQQPNRTPEDVVLAGGSHASVGAAGAPVVEDVKTREVYDVLYTYGDKPSWEKFQNYLKAYGVNDFLASRNSSKGEWYIYAGRYYDAASASRRVDELNRKTATNHAKVIRKDIPK